MDKNYQTNLIFQGKDAVKKYELLKSNLSGDETIVFCELKDDLIFCMYSEGLADCEAIRKNIIAPVKYSDSNNSKKLIDSITYAPLKPAETYEETINAILSGKTAIIAANTPQVLIADTKKIETRAINEPENEKILSGPRQGFVESLQTNISLVKKIICSPDLKIQSIQIGRKTSTKISIVYIDEVAPSEHVKEVLRRLKKIDIDAILDSNYISELIQDNKLSLFKSVGTSERPDVVSGKLLEGRIAIFVDGSPFVLTVPYLFIENFQSNEDYYINFYYATFSRLLRMLGFLLTVLVPAVYVAIVAFHHEVLPSSLMISIAMQRQSVPLSAVVEVVILLVVFDLLRETAIRMPSNIGQTLSIVGALVLGQAAVEAKLVASPMIIVVAFTGITGLLIPKLRAPITFCRFFLIACAAVLGLTGILLGMVTIIVHILTLKSIGVSQFLSGTVINKQTMKDMFSRAPWPVMRTRPDNLTSNKYRQKRDNEE